MDGYGNVAGKHRDQLERIKKSINASYHYFQPNIKRFHEFRKFCFDTAITEQEKTLLLSLDKPIIEFNVGEMFISRLRGEFSKQEPAIKVMPDDGAQVNEMLLKVVEGHIRHALYEANSNNCQYDIYTDLLSGGFSVLKLWTEYAHEMSFNQVIKFGRAFDPTLCGFDPLARYSHKGDGRYCFEYYPKSLEEFKREYPDYPEKEFRFIKTESDFNWSYKEQTEEIVIICQFYEKKKKKTKIVKLANGMVLTQDQYDKGVEEWKKRGIIQQPPAIVGKPRKTEIETICRYTICENDVLDYEETDYKYFPLIFVDGNSILIKDEASNSVRQMTRPYLYHTKGAQKLKNFAGQTLGAELENMVQHKFMVAKESIPNEEEYREAYDNMQIARTFVYNAYSDLNPEQSIPPPREIVRPDTPAVIPNTFAMMDQLFQTILGSFDASLGINDNQLSGIAIVEGATQSNSAAMPYVVGFMQAFSQLAKSYVDLMPKYYKTPRTIPIVGMDGKRTYQVINDPNHPENVSFNYDENALQVKVEAGVSFSVQKNKALQQIIALSQASPLFAQFMAAEGLDILLDNIEFRGVDVVKQKADAWMAKVKQMQEQAANQPNPQVVAAQVKQEELKLKDQEMKLKAHTHEDQMKMDIIKLEFEEKKDLREHEKEKDKIHMEKVINAHTIAHNFHTHKLAKDIHKQKVNMDRIAIISKPKEKAA